MVTLIDSYSEENRSSDLELRGLHPSSTLDDSSAGQCFTCGETINIHSAKFYLKKNNSPTGMAHAVLYAMTGTYGTDGKPTGDPLATSDDFDISTLTTDYQLITFNFTGEEQYEMQADTKYCIVFENPTSGFMVSTNYLKIGRDWTPTHDGNYCFYDNSAWSGTSGYDVCFYVYGITEPPELVEALTCGWVNGYQDHGPQINLYQIDETVYAYTEYSGPDFYGKTMKHEWWYNGVKIWDWSKLCTAHYTGWAVWTWIGNMGQAYGPGTGYIKTYLDEVYFGKTNDYTIPSPLKGTIANAKLAGMI